MGPYSRQSNAFTLHSLSRFSKSALSGIPIETVPEGLQAEVLESRNPNFKPGDFVVGMAGWQEFQATDGAWLRKVDVSHSEAADSLSRPGDE
jgi:NADPH-dependent curcumin reductase CurA